MKSNEIFPNAKCNPSSRRSFARARVEREWRARATTTSHLMSDRAIDGWRARASRDESVSRDSSRGRVEGNDDEGGGRSVGRSVDRSVGRVDEGMVGRSSVARRE